MPRFVSNRWWTFILTLCLVTAIGAALPHGAVADILRDAGGGGSGDYTGGGTAPPPGGIGDPDQPVGGSFKQNRGAVLGTRDARLTMRAAGDSRVVSSVWVWRLSVVMQVVRSVWVR